MDAGPQPQCPQCPPLRLLGMSWPFGATAPGRGHPAGSLQEVTWMDVTTRELLIPKFCGVPECPRSIFLLRPLFEVNSRGLGTASHPAPRPRVTFSRRVAPPGRAPAAGA